MYADTDADTDTQGYTKIQIHKDTDRDTDTHANKQTTDLGTI